MKAGVSGDGSTVHECVTDKIVVEPWGRLVKGRADLHDPELSSRFLAVVRGAGERLLNFNTSTTDLFVAISNMTLGSINVVDIL